MSKINSSEEWILKGYELFGLNGIDGLQVERLARVLGLNKSGFYHYFGDMDYFLEALMHHHHKIVDEFVKELPSMQTYDPEYLNFLVTNKIGLLFHMQLIRDRHIKLFFDTYLEVNEKLNKGVIKLWSEEIGLHGEVSLHSYSLLRGIIYTKLTAKNLSYDFLHQIVNDVKAMVQEIQTTPLEFKEK